MQLFLFFLTLLECATIALQNRLANLNLFYQRQIINNLNAAIKLAADRFVIITDENWICSQA